MATKTDDAFDVVVVGSGYGGAIVACRLAGAGLNVCVVERGHAFPPGSFPRVASEMLWDPDGAGTTGPRELSELGSLAVVTAAGLGGGSLLGDGVMQPLDERAFAASGLPLTRDELDPHYDRVQRGLGVVSYPIADWPYSAVPKTRALASVANADGSGPAPLAISFATDGQAPNPGEPIHEPSPNLHGRPRYTCRLVGECRNGCNYGAKNTLDYTFLSEAERAGAEIRTELEVRRVNRGAAAFALDCYARGAEVPRDDTLLGGESYRTMTARHVVLAAGAIETTRLLLASRAWLELESAQIGVSMTAELTLRALAVGCREVPGLGSLPWRAGNDPRPVDPRQGPSITFRLALDGSRAIVDDTIPPDVSGASRSTAPHRPRWRSAMRVLRERAAGRGGGAMQPDAGAMASAVGLTRRGVAPVRGTARLGRGRLEVDWHATDPTATALGRKELEDVATALGGKLVDVNQDVAHVLGGCRTGTHAEDSVVDSHGAVFGAPGLWVADGSVAPESLGPYPAMTIAALADRCAERILAGPV